jgi:enoyl-CoA hydratase
MVASNASEMTPKSHEMLELEGIGSVLRVTLNRPERRNALSSEMMGELLEVISAAERDRDVRVLVFRGAGTGFCSGYDVSPSPGGDGGGTDIGPIERTHAVERDNRLFDLLWASPVPTIAQIHGYCLAGGTDLALCCDLIVCAADARIGYPAVRSMGTPATHMWLYHLGPQWTKRLLLTGDSLAGTKAAELGLALDAVPPAELDAHVLALATRIARIERDLLSVNKRVVNRGLDLMGRTLLQETAATQDVLGRFAAGADTFSKTAIGKGLKAAIAERDGPFAEGDPIA